MARTVRGPARMQKLRHSGYNTKMRRRDGSGRRMARTMRSLVRTQRLGRSGDNSKIRRGDGCQKRGRRGVE